MSDPRLQQLASEAAEKIKAIASDHNDQIQAIYQDYQHKHKAAAIRAESSADGIESAPALPSEPHPQRHQKR